MQNENCELLIAAVNSVFYLEFRLAANVCRWNINVTNSKATHPL